MKKKGASLLTVDMSKGANKHPSPRTPLYRSIFSAVEIGVGKLRPGVQLQPLACLDLAPEVQGSPHPAMRSLCRCSRPPHFPTMELVHIVY